eukprot:jgi/Botrbrau1/16540/Bobra.0327s0007.1
MRRITLDARVCVPLGSFRNVYGSVSLKGGASNTRKDLSNLSVTPKRSLGQNFVISEDILSRITDTTSLQQGHIVLEIGPGTGNLTKQLLRTGAKIIAVEKDDKLFENLQQSFCQEANLALIHGDILDVDLPAILKEHTTKWASACQKVTVVANLPYNISSDFLKLILPMSDLIDDVYLMLQEEVANRVTSAMPGTSEYRAMSIFVQFYSVSKYLFRISRKAFFPVPGVDSAFVHFRLLAVGERPWVSNQDRFWALVKSAFSQRRKTLRNSLKSLYNAEAVVEGLRSLGLNDMVRAEELTLANFVALFSALDAASHDRRVGKA